MTPEFEATAIGVWPAFDVEAAVTRRAGPVDPAFRSAFLATGDAASNLERLYSGEALCVTTGQQPGLLLGPLFTLYKALTAIALARSLEIRLDRSVIPVFWVAGDDHDFVEANHLHLATDTNQVRRIALRDRNEEDPQLPLYREPLGPEIKTVLAAVADATPETEFRPTIFDWIRRHYRPDVDLASAFAGALAELLGRFGLVVLQTTDATAKQVMAPLLVRAIETARGIDRALVTRSQALRSAGRPVPVAVGEGASLVLLESELGRDRLMLDQHGYRTRRSGEAWTLDALRTVASDEPTRLSPNVLLRPVVEAALLPTVAYVAGPAELAYLPESDVVYQALGIEPQERIARWSGRIIESRIAKVLDKFAITASQLDAPEGRLETHLVRNQIPADAADALATLRDVLNTEYPRLADAAATVDPTLQKPVESASHAAARGVAEVEKRILSHLKKRNEILGQQLAKARSNLYPLGKPQERIFNSVPFLIRYGPDLVDAALAACREWTATLETAPSEA